MKTMFLGQNLVALGQVDSTNLYLQRMLAAGNVVEGTVVTAREQTQGRGQMGTEWLTSPGENLTFSFVLYPKFIPAREQYQLNLVLALGLYNTFANLVPDIRLLKVKWPNDIYYNGKKIAGILTECGIAGSWIQHAIVGIGINVNAYPTALETASCLKDICGKTIEPDSLLPDILYHIEAQYLLLRGGQFDKIKTNYIRNLYRYQEECLFERMSDESTFTGQILGIGIDGRLAVAIQGKVNYFYIKELKYL